MPTTVFAWPATSPGDPAQYLSPGLFARLLRIFVLSSGERAVDFQDARRMGDSMKGGSVRLTTGGSTLLATGASAGLNPHGLATGSSGTHGAFSGRQRCGAVTCFAACLLVLLVCCGAVLAQTKQRKEAKPPKSEPVVRLPDEQTIDLRVSEMLAAWQIGDVEMLHKYYADDVAVVSGTWEPPLLGWANFAQAYLTQRKRMESGRLDRRNTTIRVNGNLAWVVYQWEFSALVDGKPTTANGHTTLVLEKRNDRWLIVHNHTSIVPEMREAPAPPKDEPKPNRPPPTV